MKKLEQMLERASEKYPNLVSVIPAHWSNPDEEGTKTAIPRQEIPVDIISLITEVWNEAIKECEGCVPEVKRGDKFDHFPGVRIESIKQGLHPKYDTNAGHNSCRNQTLQAIRKLIVWEN